MSAEIVQFIRRPKHDREQTDFPTIAFRSTAPRDITMDDADYFARISPAGLV